MTAAMALPVSQKKMLNHTVVSLRRRPYDLNSLSHQYLPNDGLTSEFQSLGIRAAEAAVIVMFKVR
jgi:hypothetical protein